jgi:hypothetical protein
MTGDGDMVSSSLGLSVGRDADETTKMGGFDVPMSVGSQVDTLGTTEVQLDIDISTDEGRAQFERFTQTGLLPGADRVETTDEGYTEDLAGYQALEQELAGMTPGSEAYFEKQAEVYAASSELNGAFMTRSTFLDAESSAPDSVTYQKWRTQTDQTVTTSAELFAWKMSRVLRGQRVLGGELARRGLAERRRPHRARHELARRPELGPPDVRRRRHPRLRARPAHARGDQRRDRRLRRRRRADHHRPHAGERGGPRRPRRQR